MLTVETHPGPQMHDSQSKLRAFRLFITLPCCLSKPRFQFSRPDPGSPTKKKMTEQNQIVQPQKKRATHFSGGAGPCGGGCFAGCHRRLARQCRAKKIARPNPICPSIALLHRCLVAYFVPSDRRNRKSNMPVLWPSDQSNWIAYVPTSLAETTRTPVGSFFSMRSGFAPCWSRSVRQLAHGQMRRSSSSENSLRCPSFHSTISFCSASLTLRSAGVTESSCGPRARLGVGTPYGDFSSAGMRGG